MAYNLKAIQNLLYHLHTYLSGYFLQHLANESISVSFWGKTAFPSAVWGYTAPLCLSCPSFGYQQLVCSNGSYITHLNPPTTITQVLILLHMLALWVCDLTHTVYAYTILQTFFLFSFLSFKQASWPRILMSGTVTNIGNITRGGCIDCKDGTDGEVLYYTFENKAGHLFYQFLFP